MKKNITINMFGVLYAIDDDACQLLEQYLDNMHRYFDKREGGTEIVDDIEHRVAELLSDLKAQGVEAISIGHVQQIIQRIGNPEQMDEEQATNSEETEAGDKTDDHSAEDESTYNKGRANTTDRKLYRDP